MAGAFPTLRRGNTVFYPLKDTQSFGTSMAKFVDDSEQRWRKRPMLRRFKLTCNDIDAYDVALLMNFFRSQFGKFDSTWTLTIAGTTYSNLAFNSDAYQITESKPNRMSLTFDIMQVKSDTPTIPAATSYFPQINSQGVMTTLPYNSGFNYRTTSEDSEYTGRRFAWKWRAAPLGGYIINLQRLSAAELTVVQNFFYSMEGKKGEFTFLDPGGNLVTYSDLFSDASWAKVAITVGASVTDPQGGTQAVSLASTGADGTITATVIPAGGASGFVLTASVWARATGASQQLSIGIYDNTYASMGNTTFSLPQNVWVRIMQSVTVSNNLPVLVRIGGNSTWGTGQTIQLFSASCVPLPGPGPRLLTPGADALRPYCRFDTDDFVINYQDYGQTSVNLPIIEYTH